MKIRSSAAWTLALAMALVACRGPSGPDSRPLQGTPLPSGKVSVLEFGLDDAIVDYHTSVDTFGLAVAEEIARGLRERGHDAEAVPASGTTRGDFVVRGSITRIDGGSRAQRYWVGFGAGAAKLGVAGDVQRADGTALGSFTHERWSGFGVFGGATESLMQRCQRAVGEDIAEMVHTGAYRQVAP